MKKIILIITLLFSLTASYAQDWETNFDPPKFQQSHSNRFYIDTITYPNNKWQIGNPSKTVFTAAYSKPNALVTDTLNPLPPNDTSVIYVKHYLKPAAKHLVFGLCLIYRLDGDSTDKGVIEFSPDKGLNWINVLTEDTTYQIHWWSPKPTLTGSTPGWDSSFCIDLTAWASNPGNFPIQKTTDTIVFRLSYITDSNSTARDGWIIDNLKVEDIYTGIDEIQNDNLISISPNPAADKLKIQRAAKSNSERIQIVNIAGQILIDEAPLKNDFIDTRSLCSGIYFLKYSDGKSFAIKKFIVQH